ncbi:MAG: hypothetical protein Ta2F_18020 [Termitinemataceae bacterium]|nr:MAG: hypothetical protein Ta2F_18020 [Termitinemataceae bacterium]
MYTREILAHINSPIQNGLAVQGTWNTPFDIVDLKKLTKPFFIKLPQWVLKFFIKEWQNFYIQEGDFYLTAFIADMKYFSFVELFFLDKNSGNTIQDFKIFPFSKWKSVNNLKNTNISADTSDFSFKVHNWLDSHSVRLDIDIAATFDTLNFTAQLEFDFDVLKSTPLCVNLLCAENRCLYTYKELSAVRGRIIWGEKRIVLHRKTSTGLFCDNKGYYPIKSKLSYCSAFWKDENGQTIGFSLCEKKTKNKNENNENVLWVNGIITALPAIRITQVQDGENSEWIIQDLEGMVDLTFRPKKKFENKFSVFLSNFEHKIPMGCFNGVILDSCGNAVKLHNFFGVAEIIDFRI